MQLEDSIVNQLHAPVSTFIDEEWIKNSIYT